MVRTLGADHAELWDITGHAPVRRALDGWAAEGADVAAASPVLTPPDGGAASVDDLRDAPEPWGRHGARSAAVTAVRSPDGEAVGVLCAVSATAARFGPDELRLLDAAARVLAAAWAGARRAAGPVRPADRDELVACLDDALRDDATAAVGVVVVELAEGADDTARDELVRRLQAELSPGTPVATLDRRAVAVPAPGGGEREATVLARRLLTVARDLTAPGPGGEEATAFAGVAVGLAASADPDQLLDDGWLAARQAHAQRSATVELFDPAMRRRLSERAALAADLRHAVDAGELRLAYQPIVSLADGRVVAAEALLRWRHPLRGAVPAAEFLPLAEEEGLVGRIGSWVLDEAVAQLAAWDADPHVDLGYLAINVFGQQLLDPAFARDLERVLDRAGIAASRIALELTEAAVSDSPLALAMVEQLHGLGVRLLLDDFGTGASSLRSLRHLPVDGVKIDGSFVAGLAEHAGDRHIATAIIGMAGALGIEVIAEGVETADQARWLRRLGCAVAQGFLFARPTLPEDLGPVLASRAGGGTRDGAFGPVEDPTAVRPAGRAWVRGEEQLITLGQAAQALGISASTARRWADSGQLRVIRTAGGHRRFARADVERLAGTAGALPVVRKPTTFPAAPAVGALLARHGGEWAAVAARSVYEDGATGWLGGERARAALDRFALELAAAVRGGDEAVAGAAVRQLLDDAHEAGAALVEVDSFLSRYFALAARALRGREACDEELHVVRLLAASTRHLLLEHAEHR